MLKGNTGLSGRIPFHSIVRLALWSSLLLPTVMAVSHANDAPELSFEVQRFDVVGQLPFSEQKTASILAPFTGQHAGLEGLQAAGDALEAELRKAGYAFFEVSLPPQTLALGVVSLEVVQQRVGKVLVSGHTHYTEENIKASVPTLEIGLPPNTREISRSVGLANENPSKTVKVAFAGGTRPGEVDATIKVEDSRQWNAFTSLSNTGNALTGKWRNTLGFQHNNLFDKDHSYTAALTYAPGEGSVVSQLSINYRLPLYGQKASLNFYLSRSDVDTGIVDLNSAAGGSPQLGSLLGGGQVSGLRINKPLLNLGRYRHSISLSLEDKLVDNNTLISDLGLEFDDKRRSTPVALGYDWGYQYGKSSWSSQLQYIKNAELNNYNEQRDYDAAPGAPNVDWDLWRLNINQDIGFGPNWIWRFQASAQRANEVLISGEKYGIGGIASVRGYQERAISGDNAMLFKNELWLKPVSSLAIRPIVFYDWGETTNLRDSSTGRKLKQQLAGFGVGARWQWRKQLSAQLDVARAREAIGLTDTGDVRAHFSLFARF